MTTERAIEILNPEHREHYKSIEIVEEACRLGMAALKKQNPKTPLYSISPFYKCRECENDLHEGQKYCDNCGQALDWA